MILKELLALCDDGNAMITIVREDGMELENAKASLLYVQNYGYIVETEHCRYCLRCNPSPGNYNGYLTAYDLDVQRQNMAQEEAPHMDMGGMV